jgi:hypothetical protein
VDADGNHYDALSSDTPVRITSGPVIFDQLAQVWRNSKTVAIEVRRAAVNDALTWAAQTWTPPRQILTIRGTQSRRQIDDTVHDLSSRDIEIIGPSDAELDHTLSILDSEDRYRLTDRVRRWWRSRWPGKSTVRRGDDRRRRDVDNGDSGP